MPSLLVFDTSGERFAAGLRTPRGAWFHEGPGGAEASAGLVPALHALLARGGLGFRELDAIAFGQGPGAFTGLRTACAVAQGLAEAIGRPVLPLDTLEAVALDAWQRANGRRAEVVWVAQDARMDEIYAAGYAIDANGDSRCLHPPALWTAEALTTHWSLAAPTLAPTLVGGSALRAYGARLSAQGAQADAEAWPSPAALLALAGQAWQRGAGVSPAEARPAYVRDRVALTTAEREARAAAT